MKLVYLQHRKGGGIRSTLAVGDIHREESSNQFYIINRIPYWTSWGISQIRAMTNETIVPLCYSILLAYLTIYPRSRAANLPAAILYGIQSFGNWPFHLSLIILISWSGSCFSPPQSSRSCLLYIIPSITRSGYVHSFVYKDFLLHHT